MKHFTTVTILHYQSSYSYTSPAHSVCLCSREACGCETNLTVGRVVHAVESLQEDITV